MRYIFPCLLLAACASNPQLTAFDNAINSGAAALVSSSKLACEVAVDLDPSGATAACYAIDEAGTLVGPLLTVVETVASISALTAKTSAGMKASIKAKRAGK